MGTSYSEVHVTAAAFIVAMLKNGFVSEASDFVEWYLDEFGHDLEYLLQDYVDA